MKIDRMMAIITYLLNHEVVAASALAEKFEVSKRTIQRDIDSLNQAGLPIVSLYGANGGYKIIDGFQLTKQMVTNKDYQNIIASLKGLNSAYKQIDLYSTLEKSLNNISYSEQKIFIDYSVAQEGIAINEKLKYFEKAIYAQKSQHIRYINADNAISERTIEPLALMLQWYSWYLFAFCTIRNDYRFFKLARILDYREDDLPFSAEHKDVEMLIEQAKKCDSRTQYSVKLYCNNEIRHQILEYLSTNITKELENGDFIIEIKGPFDRLWFSMLLGFGNKVLVLEPEELKVQLREHANNIVSLYSNSDI